MTNLTINSKTYLGLTPNPIHVMGRDFPSIFFLLTATVCILLWMGMCFLFPLSMQNHGSNFLLFGSFILNPRAFLNRLGKQFGKCDFQLKPNLRVKQNPCCVFLTGVCKGAPLGHCQHSGGHLSLAGNLNSQSPQKTEGS